MKKGFTLIELIISIVIIGIASASIPLMMSAANKLQEQTINQDVYFKSVTVMTDILSKYWDANIATQDANGNEAMMVRIQNADTAKTDTLTLNAVVRPGNFARLDFDFRKFYSAGTTASPIVSTPTLMTDTTAMSSMDAYSGGYIDEVNVDSKVRYDVKVEYVPDIAKIDPTNAKRQTATWSFSGGGADGVGSTDTNLKRITITAKRTVGSETMNASFVYFSSNIGTPGLKVQ